MARLADKKLLKSFQSKQCVICNAQAEPYHINGNHDLIDNLLPICRIHIQKIKQLGFNAVVDQYPKMEIELSAKNWEYDLYNGRWINYEIFQIEENA